MMAVESKLGLMRVWILGFKCFVSSARVVAPFVRSILLTIDRALLELVHAQNEVEVSSLAEKFSWILIFDWYLPYSNLFEI